MGSWGTPYFQTHPYDISWYIYCLFAHPTSSKDVAKTMAMYHNPPMGSHDPIIGELKNKHAMRHDGETVKPHQR